MHIISGNNYAMLLLLQMGLLLSVTIIELISRKKAMVSVCRLVQKAGSNANFPACATTFPRYL